MGEENATPRLSVRVLGPLQLVVDGEEVEVRGPKRRAVLAMLALAEGRTVTVERLLDALWPSEIPESGRQALHTHVSRLRAALAPAADRLATSMDGYRLDLDAVDVARARALLGSARAADPAQAAARLREALALWRGPVLADLLDVAPIAEAAQACHRLRRDVTDALVDASIEAGAAGSVLELATAEHAADPLREPAVLLLMRALAATGHAPEALRVGRDHRRALADQTGLDPSPALDDLERRMASGGAAPTPVAVPDAPRPEPARPATPLVGRDEQVATLHRLLADERLITLVGPGGVGKTRVALEVARRTDTATVLLLAPVTDPAAVPHALAAALSLTATRDDVLAACLAELGARPGLLVVDNCEHLIDAAREVVDAALAACPGLTVLATSREPLALPVEHRYRLAPLPLPRGGDVARSPSVQVFLDRARRVGATPRDLAVVAEIVCRLDGIPLAIELAAGRLSGLSLVDLRDRLDRALDLFGAGRSPGEDRHRTLRAAVEWSYQLLFDDEQRLFRHLAAFPDGVDLDTGEQVAADLGLRGDPGHLLGRLVDASMVEADLDGPARYRMLEPLRMFGLDRLAAAGEDDAALQRLVRWAVDLTAWLGTALLGERVTEADARLRREIANLRAAWRTARDRGLLDSAVAIVTGLFEVVVDRDLVEIRGWADELADDPAIAGHPQGSLLLGTAAFAAYHQGDYERADRRARAGLTGDASAFCLQVTALVALARGQFSEVFDLARRTDPETYRLWLLGIEALAMAHDGDVDGGRALITQGLAGPLPALFRGWYTYFAGEIEHVAGRTDEAERYYLRAVEEGRISRTTFLVGMASVGLLALQAATGRERTALAGYRDVVEYFARTGSWTHLRVALRNLATLLARLGDEQTATRLRAATAARGTVPRDPGWVGAATSAVEPPPPDVLDTARAAIARHLAVAS